MYDLPQEHLSKMKHIVAKYVSLILSWGEKLPFCINCDTTQIVTKLKNSNCDKTQNLKLHRNKLNNFNLWQQ